MPSFVFDSAPVAAFPIRDYYLVVVETIPLITDTVRNQLVEPAAFPIYNLTGKTVTPGVSMTFTDFTLPSFTYPNAVRGVVICQRHPTNAPSGADSVVSFTPFSDHNGLDVVLPAGTFRIQIAWPLTGAIRLADVYRYTCGSYVHGANGGLPFGIMYLMGTVNGTLGYVNPSATGARKLVNILGSDGTIPAALFDRLSSVFSTASAIGLDFGLQRIRVGKIGFNNAGSPNTWEVYASNDIPGGFSAATINGTAPWTLIMNPYSITTETGYLTVPGNSLDTSTYWRYLKLLRTSGSNNQLREIEFWESTIETPYANFFP